MKNFVSSTVSLLRGAAVEPGKIAVCERRKVVDSGRSLGGLKRIRNYVRSGSDRCRRLGDARLASLWLGIRSRWTRHRRQPIGGHECFFRRPGERTWLNRNRAGVFCDSGQKGAVRLFDGFGGNLGCGHLRACLDASVLYLRFELIDPFLHGFKRSHNRRTHRRIQSIRTVCATPRQRQIHLCSLVIRHDDGGPSQCGESLRLRAHLISPRAEARDCECAVTAADHGEIRTFRHTVYRNLCVGQRLPIRIARHPAKSAGCIRYLQQLVLLLMLSRCIPVRLVPQPNTFSQQACLNSRSPEFKKS